MAFPWHLHDVSMGRFQEHCSAQVQQNFWWPLFLVSLLDDFWVAAVRNISAESHHVKWRSRYIYTCSGKVHHWVNELDFQSHILLLSKDFDAFTCVRNFPGSGIASWWCISWFAQIFSYSDLDLPCASRYQKWLNYFWCQGSFDIISKCRHNWLLMSAMSRDICTELMADDLVLLYKITYAIQTYHYTSLHSFYWRLEVIYTSSSFCLRASE